MLYLSSESAKCTRFGYDQPQIGYKMFKKGDLVIVKEDVRVQPKMSYGTVIPKGTVCKISEYVYTDEDGYADLNNTKAIFDSYRLVNWKYCIFEFCIEPQHLVLKDDVSTLLYAAKFDPKELDGRYKKLWREYR